MKLSIIVPTYNRADRVTDCLDAINASIEKANNVEIELIVVDNNSTDETQSVLKAWGQDLEFDYYVLIQPKQGANAARNMALHHATGDLFVLLDDDGFIQDDYIQRVYDLYKNDDVSILRFSKIDFARSEDWPMTIKTSPHFQSWQKYGTEAFRIGEIIGCSMIFTREIFEKVGFYDEMFSTSYVPGGNDTEYCIRIYNAGFVVEYVPDLVLKHAHGRDTQEAVAKLIKKYCIGGGACYAKFLWNHPHIQNKRLKKTSPKHPAIPVGEQDERNEIISRLYAENRNYVYQGICRYYYVKLYNFFVRKWREK